MKERLVDWEQLLTNIIFIITRCTRVNVLRIMYIMLKLSLGIWKSNFKMLKSNIWGIAPFSCYVNHGCYGVIPYGQARVCEGMSYEESEKIVFLCRYPPFG